MIQQSLIAQYAARHGVSFYEAARRLGRAGGKAAARARRAKVAEREREAAFRRMREQRPDLYD